MRKNRLKEIRLKCQMNQKDFAELLDMDQGQLSRYENQKAQPQDKTCFEKILPRLKRKFPRIDYEDLWK